MEQRHFCDTKKETHLILPECQCDCSSCQSYRSCAHAPLLPSMSPSPSKSKTAAAAEMIANGANPQTLLIQAIMDLTQAIREQGIQTEEAIKERLRSQGWMRPIRNP